jgi:hypothetical protein
MIKAAKCGERKLSEMLVAETNAQIAAKSTVSDARFLEHSIKAAP